MKQLLIVTAICVFVFAACDAAVSGTLPIDDINGSNNDDPNINPTIDPPVDPPVDPWSFPVVTELWEPGEYTDDESVTITGAYPIDNWRQLQFIGETFLEDPTLLTHTYYLTADITFPSRDVNVPAEFEADSYVVDGFTPIGSEINDGVESYILPFTGNFDGQRFSISDLHIIQNVHHYLNRYAGLFGRIGDNIDVPVEDRPLIRNLTLRNVNVTGSQSSGALAGLTKYSVVRKIIVEGGSVQGTAIIGGLIGEASNFDISHSSASASVSGSHTVAGLIGGVITGNVTSSYATGDVTGDVTGNVTGPFSNFGGLIGFASDSNIENTYALGTVSVSGNKIGGLVGFAITSTITTSYSRSRVFGLTNVGGLVGSGVFSEALLDNYWDASPRTEDLPNDAAYVYPAFGIGNLGSDDGAAPLTPTTAANFTGFVFSTTEGWNTPADGEWPTLYWQEEN